MILVKYYIVHQITDRQSEYCYTSRVIGIVENKRIVDDLIKKFGNDQILVTTMETDDDEVEE